MVECLPKMKWVLVLYLLTIFLVWPVMYWPFYGGRVWIDFWKAMSVIILNLTLRNSKTVIILMFTHICFSKYGLTRSAQSDALSLFEIVNAIAVRTLLLLLWWFQPKALSLHVEAPFFCTPVHTRCGGVSEYWPIAESFRVSGVAFIAHSLIYPTAIKKKTTYAKLSGANESGCPSWFPFFTTTSVLPKL